MQTSTAQNDSIPLSFRLTRGWAWLAYTLVGVLLYQLITLQRPGFGEFRRLLEGRIWEYFKFLFGYYFLFELISVFIFLRIVRWAAARFGMSTLRPDLKSLLRYELRFLPVIMGSILVFGPVTNGVRYLAVFYPDYSWAAYFPEYFFTARMFVNYALPFLIFGYVFLNVSLFLDYNDWQKAHLERLAPPGSNDFLKTLPARDEQGETVLDISEVLWFEVEEKNYRAFTRGKTFDIRKTLGELEAELDPAAFFRINRSVIVNLHFFKNYSFWEHDKYIVRLNDDKTEFVIQRARLKELRRRIGV
jgi:two-component system LytT family response regulator